MKSLILLALGLIICMPSVAQRNKYQEVMEKNIQVLDTATQVATWQNLANSFERMGRAEKSKWLPYYYAGYCAVLITYKEKDLNQVDLKADRAEQFMQLADSLNPKNADVSCLKAMIALSRIKVDFMSRGPKYSQQAMEDLMTARAFDDKNPRVYLLIGQNKYNTPEQFGGDKKMAAQLFDKAVSLYQLPTANVIDPHWGKSDALKMVQLCQQQLTKNDKK